MQLSPFCQLEATMGDPSVHQFCDYLKTPCDCPRHKREPGVMQPPLLCPR